jgi:hypothetical protein
MAMVLRISAGRDTLTKLLSWSAGYAQVRHHNEITVRCARTSCESYLFVLSVILRFGPHIAAAVGYMLVSDSRMSLELSEGSTCCMTTAGGAFGNSNALRVQCQGRP